MRSKRKCYGTMHPERPRSVAAIIAWCFLLAARVAAADAMDSPAGHRLLSVVEQEADLELLWRALSTAHSGIDRYEDLVTVEARFHALIREIERPAPALDFLAKVAAFNASLNCGHLYTIATGAIRREVLEAGRLPLAIRAVDGRIYVWSDLSNAAAIPRGSQILSINGRSTREILQLINPRVPTDGFIETRKAHLLNRLARPTYQGFDLYYSLYVERPTDFHVRYRDAHTGAEIEVSLPGVTYSQKRTRLMESEGETPGNSLLPPQFEIHEERNAALLSLPRSHHRDGDPDFAVLLHALIEQMATIGIDNLVIDVRGNNGGNDDHGPLILSHLVEAPFRYYRGLFKRRLDLSEFKPFVQEPRTDDWYTPEPEWYVRDRKGRYWELPEDGGYHLLQEVVPRPKPFLGAVYVLADGGSFSSGAQIAAMFHAFGRAMLIGEETGGDYAGPDGGQALPITLPNSEIQVRIPLLRSLNAFQSWPLGRGAVPDCTVGRSIDDTLDGRDPALDLAYELIARGINRENMHRAGTPYDLPAECR